MLTFQKDAPTVLIGENDCGKSTILLALDLLFAEKPKFNYESEQSARKDLSNTPLKWVEVKELATKWGIPSLDNLEIEPDTEPDCFIFASLVLENTDYQRLETEEKLVSNHFLWVTDNLNKDNAPLWIGRSFHTSKQTFQDLILTPDHPEMKYRQIFDQGAAQQKALRKKLEISDDEVTNDNAKGPFKNIEQSRAIYAKLAATTPLEPYWQEYDRKKEKKLFPKFALLDWETPMDILTQTTKDILADQIEPHISGAKSAVSPFLEEARKEINTSLAEFVTQFTADLPTIQEIKAHINFDISETITDFLVKKTYASAPVHMESQGEGLKRQLWFALIKWKATNARGRTGEKDVIWAFDEPETHLFPKAQREFFESIKKISAQNIQTIISTHSTIFVDRIQLSNIFQVKLDTTGYSHILSCSTVDTIHEALGVKNSDFLFYDKFLVVEGPTEETLIPKLYARLNGRTMLDDGVQLISLKGSGNFEINKLMIDQIMAGFQKVSERVHYLFDKDKSYCAISQQERSRSQITFLGQKQDLEDSLHPRVWKKYVEAYCKETHGLDVEVSEKEISRIIMEIPGDREADSRSKFFSQLEKTVRKIAQETYPDQEFNFNLLNTKGAAHAEWIDKSVEEIQTDLPENLIEVLTNIR